MPADASVQRAFDGRTLLAAFRAAVAALEAHADEINGLNVYPVPDGDTGSNMLATVRAALDEAERLAEPTVGAVATAIGFGALMGARGNSGVITSQIFRGMADGLDDSLPFGGEDLARALAAGSRTAYRAVVRPVEGTMLTVIREASEAAAEAARRGGDVQSVLAAAALASEASLARTPSLLPILRDAGVVDAGGAGLVRLMEGALQYLAGTSAGGDGRQPPAQPAAIVDPDGAGFGFEAMFLLQPRPGETLNVEAIRGSLERMGDSVLVAGSGAAIKVHVHTEQPDHVIKFGLAHGSLSRISVENLDEQAREVRELRAHEFTGAAVDAHGEPAALAVIVIATGDGFVELFSSLGCASVVWGGQGANPSTGELLRAVDRVNARQVLLLSTNSNAVLAARQVGALSGRPVTVVSTRNAAEGLAAMLALDPSASLDENAETMTRAGRSIQTLQVTEAVRDARIGDERLKKGQVIVLDPDDGLVATGTDETGAVLAGIDRLDAGYELLTMYYGEDTEEAAVQALGRTVERHRPGVEVEILRGGQRHSRYLIAAE